MAGRSAAPKPAAPGSAKRQGRQRKLKYESVPAMSSRKTEKDVIKLINSLTEWTREQQAARSGFSSAPPRGARSRARAPRAASKVSRTPSYPRGNPLTESMEFRDRDGVVWLAYVESTGLSPEREATGATVLPERHLRFDSVTESRFSSRVPAGSPFLVEARLQSLLDEARPDLPMAPASGESTRAEPGLGGRMIRWSTRGIESSREAIEDWSRGLRATGEIRRRQVSDRVAGAVNTMHRLFEGLLGHRPARP
jgi:hypothetical protein